MMRSKKLIVTVLAASFAAWGTAQAVQYYNLTQLDPNTTTYEPTAASIAAHSTATINGAIFTTIIPPQIVGTGVLDPFVRIQATKTNSGEVNSGANCGGGDPCIELGYNTDGSGVGSKKPEFQTKDNEGSNWNRTLKLSDIGTETIDGVVYRTFILDINERIASGSGHDEFLSLDQFRIFASDNSTLDKYDFNNTDPTSWKAHVKTAGATTYDTNAHELKSSLDPTIIANKVFDMDFNDLVNAQTKACANETDPANPSEGNPQGTMCDRTVGINYALNSGSGNGVDLMVRVPDTMFVGKGEFVYLFSSFGEMGKNNNDSPSPQLPAGDFSQSAGFEEWSTLKKGANPIAPTLALMLVGLVAMGGSRKWRSVLRIA